MNFKNKVFQIRYIAVWLVMVLLLHCISGVALADGRKLLQDEWMRTYIQNQRVGYTNSRTWEKQREGDIFYITEITQNFKIARAGIEFEFDIKQEIEEDADGRVTAFRQRLQQGPIEQRMTGRVEDGMLRLVSGSRPDAVEQTFEAPEGLGPWAAGRRAIEYGYEAGTSYSFAVFMLDAPSTPVVAEVRVGKREKIELYDVHKWLHRVETVFSIMPGVKSVSWVDGTGLAWLSRMDVGLFELEVRKAPKHAALQPVDEAGVALDVAVAPDRLLPDPAGLSRVRLKLKPADPGYGLPQLPSGVFQSVEMVDDGLIVEIVKPEISSESYNLPYEGSEKSGMLRESPWLEVNAPVIGDMALKAVGDEKNAYRAARRIERFVFENIEEKGLDLGFATAAETARQLSGDCTEHSVLAAALARAAGIPSRVVVGLSYGGPMPGDTTPKFYYHMWTEVWTGEWVPLDAALGGFRATNIAIVRRDLSSPDSMFDLAKVVMPLLGRIKIEVLGYQ